MDENRQKDRGLTKSVKQKGPSFIEQRMVLEIMIRIIQLKTRSVLADSIETFLTNIIDCIIVILTINFERSRVVILKNIGKC